MERIKAIAKRVLLDQQQKAPPDAYQHSFFYREANIAVIGSVFNVGDGYLQIVDLPSPVLSRVMARTPGVGVYHLARKQQCRSFNEVWVNDVSTGQGCKVSPLKYKRRNRGHYPSLPSHHYAREGP